MLAFLFSSTNNQEIKTSSHKKKGPTFWKRYAYGIPQRNFCDFLKCIHLFFEKDMLSVIYIKKNIWISKHFQF